MRSALLAISLLGCGRIGFDERTVVDAAAGDGARDGFTRVVAYGDQTCAVYRERPYCWGRNEMGALGDGTTAARATPTPLAVPSGELTALTLGDLHGCAVVSETLYCWGSPHYSPLPSAVPLPGPPTDVGAGNAFRCVVADGTVLCWGSNSAGQLGDGTTTDRDMVPAAISSTERFVAIDVGDDHACGLTDANEARCWGHNDDGALGHGSGDPPFSPTPQPVAGNVTSLPVIAGWHTCARETTGGVQCWGRNGDGELGDGTSSSRPVPGDVVNLANVTLLEVGGGPDDLDSSCAGSGSELWCWGRGSFGRLGTGDEANADVPARVTGLPPGVDIAGVAIGYTHACALLADGELWCWGGGSRGQLGDGRSMQSYAPVRVIPPM